MTTEESDPLLTNSRRNPFDRYDRTRRVSELFDSTSHNSDYSHSSHGTTTTRSRAGSGFSNDLLENAGDNPQDWQLQELEADEVTLAQACVFIEDAVHYRAIHHRVDVRSIKLYRLYHSSQARWFLSFVILLIHLLAFIENPSSLSITSDLRVKTDPYELDCGYTEAVEILCLLIFLLDCVAKSYFKGARQSLRDKWLIGYGLVLLVSFTDWFVSIGRGCPYQIRVRRMIRPFFLLQNSSLMKKTIKSLNRTIPQIASVLLLLFIHLYFFTLFGMLLFPKDHAIRNHTRIHGGDDEYNEYVSYFQNITDAFINMLVLLTTANNPDVVLPAYNVNRVYSVFFIIFLVIGLYCLMNMLTAVVYNQFRGYFMNSMQASLFRRRLGIRAAFEVLRRRKVTINFRSSFDTVSQGVPIESLKKAIEQTKINTFHKQSLLRAANRCPRTMLAAEHFFHIFTALDEQKQEPQIPEIRTIHNKVLRFIQKIFAHRYFVYFGGMVALLNVVTITAELATEYDKVRNTSKTYLAIVDMITIPFYLLEQCLRIWALGWKRYSFDSGNLFDGFITCLLVITEGVFLAIYGIPYWGSDQVEVKGNVSMWDVVRVINMLILIKLVRIITTQSKAMFIVASTLYDLIRNLKAFAGLLFVAFYSYALLGMALFKGVIVYNDNSRTNQTHMASKCGTYEQLDYWANNFDDFASACFVLWNIMVVNNWHVFLKTYSRYTTKWSQLYFIVWWLISVVIAVNLFTALILENFIMRWDRSQRAIADADAMEGENEENLDILQREDRLRRRDSYRNSADITVHDIFRNELQEPSEESLMVEIRHHPHLSLNEHNCVEA